jgi:hypothetical protein
MIGISQIYCTAQSRDVAVRNTQEGSSSSKYKLLTIPPFRIQLDVDLSVIVNGEKRQTLRHLFRSNDVGRRLSSGEEGWMTTVVDNTANENNSNKEEASANDAKPPLNNHHGAGDEGWFSDNPNSQPQESESTYSASNSKVPNTSHGEGWFSDNQSSSSSITNDNSQQSGSGSWYANENSPPKAPKVDPLSSFSAVKDALQQQPDTDGGKKTFPEYIRILLTEYTTDYVTSIAYEGLKSSERAEKGWDVVHAVDLRASMMDVTFYHEETHFIEDSDSDASDQEETFASLSFEFSGTAAILKGTNLDDIVKGNTIDDTSTSTSTTSAIHNRPIIGTHELRLMVRSAFAAPDGPYQYLKFISDESRRDEEDFVLDKMSYEDSLEHDATVLIGGSREVTVRTDMDNPGGLSPFTSSTLNEQPGSDQAERRESIAVFLEGLFLVFFLGGFYMYASYKFRRNHLKQELMKYGEGAILVKSGENTLFSPESRSKSKFNFKLKWLKYNRVKNASSPTTMQTLEEDGFFRSESFDSDYNEREDLEMGLEESYDESIRCGGGLDMSPIDMDSDINQDMSKAGVNTMKAVDDDMKTQSLSTSAVAGLHENMIENVLENVVPIPAKDDENAAYLMSKKGKKAMSDKGVSIIVQRRYVQPAAPLDVLYGAAFLHGEAERVEAQRRLRKKKKKIRASPSSRNRVKKKKSTAKLLMAQAMSGQRSKNAVNPMMTITESIDEVAEEDYDSDEDLIITASSYSPSKFMQNLSNWVMGAEVGAELNCAEAREEEEDEGDDGEDNDNECPSSAIRAMPESIEDKGNDKEENVEEDIDIHSSERALPDDEEADTQDMSSDPSDQVIDFSQAQELKEEEFVIVQDSPSNSGEGLC